MPVPVGLNVWSRLVEDTFPYLDQTAAPFESLWFPDHVQYGAHKVAEGWTLLAYALARYPDKMCTHEVICNSFRNPAHLAKMVATAHALSGGRVVLGIGAGWNEEEYRAYGWPFPPTRVRIAQMCEAIELIRLMWTTSPASYKGEHYQISGAYCEPRPDPLPPVVVGGHGEKYLLRAVAKHADWWNYSFRDNATYAHKPVVLMIQHAGLYASINTLRGVAMDGRVPVFYMIGLLSRERDKDPKESRHSMVRYCEPLLDTFGVPHARLEGPNDVHLIPEYYRLSRQRRGPTAVLVGLETS